MKAPTNASVCPGTPVGLVSVQSPTALFWATDNSPDFIVNWLPDAETELTDAKESLPVAVTELICAVTVSFPL